MVRSWFNDKEVNGYEDKMDWGNLDCRRYIGVGPSPDNTVASRDNLNCSWSTILAR